MQTFWPPKQASSEYQPCALLLGACAFFWGLAGCARTTAETPNSGETTASSTQAASETSSLDLSSSASSSTQLPDPSSKAEDFFGFVDGNPPCTPSAQGLAWERSLKQPSFDPAPLAGTVRGRGGVWMTGQARGQTWLGVLSSSGEIVASTTLHSGIEDPLRGRDLAENSQGVVMIVGDNETELLEHRKNVGLTLMPSSLAPNWWEIQGPANAASSSDLVRSSSDGNFIVSGTYWDSSKDPLGFVNKVSKDGATMWRIPNQEAPEAWPFHFVHDIEEATDGAIYVLGGHLEKQGEDSERALIAKLDPHGKMVWTSYLETLSKLDEKGLPINTSIARYLELSLDGSTLWVVGSMGTSGQDLRKGRMWKVSAKEGAVTQRFEIETAPSFGKKGLSAFTGLEVTSSGVFYSWSMNRYREGKYVGIESQIARINNEGRRDWYVNYSPSQGPGKTSHVRMLGLVNDRRGGVYALGTRFKAPVLGGEPLGEVFGYAARFCPPRREP